MARRAVLPGRFGVSRRASVMSSRLARRSRKTRSMPSPPLLATRSSAVRAGTVTRKPSISVTNSGLSPSRARAKPGRDERPVVTDMDTSGTAISGQNVSRAADRPVSTPSGIHSDAARMSTSGVAASCHRQKTPGVSTRSTPARASRSAVRRSSGCRRAVKTASAIKVALELFAGRHAHDSEPAAFTLGPLTPIVDNFDEFTRRRDANLDRMGREPRNTALPRRAHQDCVRPHRNQPQGARTSTRSPPSTCWMEPRASR